MPLSNLEEECRAGTVPPQLFLHEAVSIANVFILYLAERAPGASLRHTLQRSLTDFLSPHGLRKAVLSREPEMPRVGNCPECPARSRERVSGAHSLY